MTLSLLVVLFVLVFMPLKSFAQNNPVTAQSEGLIASDAFIDTKLIQVESLLSRGEYLGAESTFTELMKDINSFKNATELANIYHQRSINHYLPAELYFNFDNAVVSGALSDVFS
jgi:hypothetical protein